MTNLTIQNYINDTSIPETSRKVNFEAMSNGEVDENGLVQAIQTQYGNKYDGVSKDTMTSTGISQNPVQLQGFLSQMGQGVKERMAGQKEAGVSKLKEGIGEFAKGWQEGKPLETATGALKGMQGIAQGTAGQFMGAVQPITEGIEKIGAGIGGAWNKLLSAVVPDAIENPIKAQALEGIHSALKGGQLVSGMVPDNVKALVKQSGLTGMELMDFLPFAFGIEGAPALAKNVTKIPEMVKGAAEKIPDAMENVKRAVYKRTEAVKQGISPTLSPAEAVGQIIQGEPSDIPAAKRALKSLDTEGVKTQADLQAKINKEIPVIAKKVDTEFAKDASLHTVDDFNKTVGEGENVVQTNYVKDAIQQLKDYFIKINDAKGLSKIKALENKISSEGITYGDVNKLARTHGSELNAFNANGELSTGLSKQTAENTRMGLKDTAREGLGNPKAKVLDSNLSDLYDTKRLIDKQVIKVNTAIQKMSKQGILPKIVGKTIKFIDIATGNPLKAIGKEMGNLGASGSLSPIELEQNLSKNLEIIRKEISEETPINSAPVSPPVQEIPYLPVVKTAKPKKPKIYFRKHSPNYIKPDTILKPEDLSF